MSDLDNRNNSNNSTCDRDRDQRGKKDRRFNNDYKRNRGSYHGGYQKDFGKRPFKRNWSNNQNDGKRKKLEVGRRLKEHEVGITEFIGSEGFFGVIKERYTDFHVNEITLDGETAKLTNQDMPEDPKEDQNIEDLQHSIPDKIWDLLQALKDPVCSSIKIDVTNMDKNQRRAIHTIAKKLTNVISQTVDKETKKIMVIVPDKQDNSSSHNIRRDNRVDWKKRGEYCYFVLHKVNMDTMDALNQLAMNLRIKSNNFNYAGTKDRRAWTTQWVSLRRMEPLDILRAAKNVRGAYVGNFKFMKKPLKLGMLNGNHFRIALRNVNGTDEQIEQTMISLRDHGFINYYGLQRFGTVAAIPTYDIGKALLQGKWNEAIELILKPREGEQDRDLAEARKVYASTKDAATAYKKIRRYDKIEATLLKGICISGNNNPQGALDAIPRNARLMYIHAYQSFVWNHMVSRRIKEFGRKPVAGDLVYENNTKQNDNDSDTANDNDNENFVYVNENEVKTEDNTESNEKTIKQEAKDVLQEDVNEHETETEDNTESNEKTIKPEAEDVNENEVEAENNTEPDEKTSEHKHEAKDVLREGEMTEVPMETSSSIKEVTDATECCLKINENVADSNTTNEKDDNEDLLNLPTVKILTEEDLPNYTLADVLMPQVGWKVTYPLYAKSWYDEFLTKDGLTTDLRQKNKKYSLGGAYRKILQVPTNLSWKTMHYKEKHSDLIMCDIDEIRKSSPPKDEPEGQYKALIIEMSLKSSTYATMALREILKYDTSAQAQAAQSAACNPDPENANTSKNITENVNICSLQDTNKNVDEGKSLELEAKQSNDSNTLKQSEQDDGKMEMSNAV
ncbi:PREDICTED: pseudouridylate synthase 7 homolog [Dufourea novaeangliae]|uniref:pseudouridylate synthase 7 homolog n=1 Tax=Dufourea novaeangliae TaxID=178035 RepID=UPI000766FCB6|nr:PREDICTED: pseudouridylate synthase 7 homolog [Dufourea novaeangliae]